MKIETESYTLDFDESENNISISGSLRLNGMGEYASIFEALQKALHSGKALKLNLTGLDFLNSSGIAMLAKFTIEARGIDNCDLSITGSAQIPWQGKSLKNLQRLFPALKLIIT